MSTEIENKNLNRCVFTGNVLNHKIERSNDGNIYQYDSPDFGKVKVAINSINQLRSDKNVLMKIASITKNRTIQGEEPILIDSEFIKEGYKKYYKEMKFEEKCRHLLKYIYEAGGDVNMTIKLIPAIDFTLCYSNPDEFERVINQLEKDYFITYEVTRLTGDSKKHIYNTEITGIGVEEVKKILPKMPLYGLVSQEINTGNYEIDKKINHARELFFSEPVSMDKMRSACETLSYVLEPLRKDLQKYFESKDVNDFFIIVNKFDIRHNKISTHKILIEEQLEWVFYSLLNTINAYYKIKDKQS